MCIFSGFTWEITGLSEEEVMELCHLINKVFRRGTEIVRILVTGGAGYIGSF